MLVSRFDDRDVERFLLQLTLLPVDRVAEVMADLILEGYDRIPEPFRLSAVIRDV